MCTCVCVCVCACACVCVCLRVCGRNELNVYTTLAYPRISSFRTIHKYAHTCILKRFEDSELTGLKVDIAVLQSGIMKRKKKKKEREKEGQKGTKQKNRQESGCCVLSTLGYPARPIRLP